MVRSIGFSQSSHDWGRDMAKKCKGKCGSAATEANGYCFMCAEEMACMMYEVTMEFGGGDAKARANAQAAWKGW